MMYTLIAPGMSCQPCARTINTSIQQWDPEAEVRIDVAKKTVNVATEYSLEQLQKVIKEAGYETRLA